MGEKMARRRSPRPLVELMIGIMSAMGIIYWASAAMVLPQPGPQTALADLPTVSIESPAESLGGTVGGFSAQQGAPPPPQYNYSSGANQNRQSDDGGDFEIPEFSVRLDPFNWLLEGRLGLELEVQAWKFITVETVPIFVMSEKPPTLRFSGRADNLTQHSDGLGAMSGASLGVGFWLNGKPFRGYVLRAILTNYAYEYRTRWSDPAPGGDSVQHTERQFLGFLGSYSRFGPFTIGGGIGLGVELNKDERCLPEGETGCGDLLIQLDSAGTEVTNLHEWSYPVVVTARISLGFVF